MHRRALKVEKPMAKQSPVAGVDLTPEEEANLLLALGGVAADLDKTLAPFAAAALREYVDMFNGQAMTSLTELKEQRLLAILLSLPAKDFPTDDQIAKWFGLTTDRARAFLRNTLARNRNRLRDVMKAAAKSVLATAAQTGDEDSPFEARFPNAVLIQMLNDDLAVAKTVRSPITKKASTFDTYVIPKGSMTELTGLYP
ncbi:hypothetical protein [Brevundimonas sp.]|uniref:hypothetical protein n=1 Tax=Brevundimonas sp. TaxID=1871086 RepID=UPI0028ADE2A5|nr:hypothetical protein [Brevundimonas sp.]